MSDGVAIREGQILSGLLFSEPMRVETVRTEQFRRVTLRKADLAGLTITDTSLLGVLTAAS